MRVDELESYRFPDPVQGRRVFRVGAPGARIPVVLLHEIGGLAPGTVQFADYLVDKAGCEVHMPLLFGEPGQESPSKGFAQLCWSREIVLLLGGRRSKVADWLVDLCADIGTGRPPGVTVIGMCATGGLVFSVLAADGVAAGVAAQPALPFRLPRFGRSIRSLGASVDDVEAAAASGRRLLATRYTEDRICPAGRLLQIDETFPGSVLLLDGPGHSTLVQHAHPDARGAVLELLAEVYGTESET